VSAQLDAFFTEYMTLYAQARTARAEANAALSAGFFALSEARHALPSLPLDSSAYAGRDMLPLVAVTAQPAFPLPAGEAQPRTLAQLETPVKFKLLEDVPLKDVREDGEADAADEEEDEAAAEAGSSMRQRKGKDATTAAAAASSASASAVPAAGDASSSDDATAAAPVDLRRNPVGWFGVLAPASLSTGATSFRGALRSLCVVSSLSSRLGELERKFLALAALQQASHVDPAVEEQLEDILAKIRISDERKKGAEQGAQGKEEEKQQDAAEASKETAPAAGSAAASAAAAAPAAAAAADKQ